MRHVASRSAIHPNEGRKLGSRGKMEVSVKDALGNITEERAGSQEA
jgi:hypothetical protein